MSRPPTVVTSSRRLDEVARPLVTGVGSVNTTARVAYSVAAASNPHSAASGPSVVVTGGTPGSGPVTDTDSEAGRSSSAEPFRSAAAAGGGGAAAAGLRGGAGGGRGGGGGGPAPSPA